MQLPHYFMADLPAHAGVDSSTLDEACLTLIRNRNKFLAHRSTESLVDLISNTAREWCNPGSPYRKLALEQGPAMLGFSEGTLAAGLDHFLGSVTRQSLNQLLLQELGHPERLDRLVTGATELQTESASIVRGPEFLVQITAGNLPCPALMSLILGLLSRSAQFIKCASGTSLLPRLFAHSIRETDPKLASCIEIAEWSRDRSDLHSILYSRAHCVTATGDDETIAGIRNHLPPGIRFAGYGHRVSFGYISRDALGTGLDQVAERAAHDVAAWDQLGCLSPHLIYVEGAHNAGADDFAARLAGQLAELERTQPRGPLPAETSALIAGRRDFYSIRADHSDETKLWASPASTAWTVVYEADPIFQRSCLHRFVYVKPVANLNEALRYAEPIREQVSTVGIAARADAAADIASALAHWGVTRVCPLGRMQRPPLTWRHDGRPALAELLTWTNWEKDR